jgi:hypothetical protein
MRTRESERWRMWEGWQNSHTQIHELRFTINYYSATLPLDLSGNQYSQNYISLTRVYHFVIPAQHHENSNLEKKILSRNMLISAEFIQNSVILAEFWTFLFLKRAKKSSSKIGGISKRNWNYRLFDKIFG